MVVAVHLGESHDSSIAVDERHDLVRRDKLGDIRAVGSIDSLQSFEVGVRDVESGELGIDEDESAGLILIPNHILNVKESGLSLVSHSGIFNVFLEAVQLLRIVQN